MRLTIRTRVRAALPDVWAGFDRSLFLKLAPPFPPVRLVQFDGCQPDNRVILELNFIAFRQTWESLITETKETEEEIYFIDRGVRLPFFLRMWEHRHRLVRQGEQTLIIDDISYTTPNRVMDYLMYPLLWGQFAYRVPIYKRVFRNAKPASASAKP